MVNNKSIRQLVNIEDPLLHQTFAGYEFVEHLGSGAFGAVYRARHPNLAGREVAVKYIRMDDAETADLTETEINIMSQLEHDHVVQIYDAYRLQNLRLIIMELVRGGSLRKWVKDRGATLELPVILQGMEQVASALDYIHSKNVLHLDLKPENILLKPVHDEDMPRFLITDFGVAKINRTGTIDNAAGTPAYMSPEHFGIGDYRPDPRSDIYSFGVMLYELVVGQLPFTADNIGKLLQMQAYEQPPRPSDKVPGLPEKLDEIILKALAKSPRDRFKRARDIGRELKDLYNQISSDKPGTNFVASVQSPISTLTQEQPSRISTLPLNMSMSLNSFQLYVRYPNGEEQKFVFSKPSIVIGRDTDADLPLADKDVSRRHLQIDYANEDKALYVTDLNSRNGSYLGGERLEPQNRVLWNPDKTIILQHFKLALRSIEESGREAMPLLPRIANTDIVRLRDIVQDQPKPPRIGINVTPPVIQIEPNTSERIHVTVRPENTAPAYYTLRVSPGPNIDERWYTLPANGMRIEPGESRTFEMLITPPDIGPIGGQNYELVLEIACDNPDVPAVVQVINVKVARFMRFNVALNPAEISHNRRRKSDLSIWNNGNYSDSFIIYAELPSGLNVKPSASEITIGPREQKSVELQFNPARDAAQDGRLLYRLRVMAKTSGMTERADGSYVYRTPRPRILSSLLRFFVFIFVIVGIILLVQALRPDLIQVVLQAIRSIIK